MPLYNAGKYVAVALDSILNQDFQNWECILVEDGSEDETGVICDRYAENDGRFRVFHVSNGGVSKARNIGLKESRGRFIAFVDSDDWVEKDFLSFLYNLISRYGADVAQGSFRKEYRTFGRNKVLSDKETVLDKTTGLKELLRDSSLPSFLWNKLFRRELLTASFPEGKVYEDFDAMSSWYKNIFKTVISPKIIYHYRMRRGSITSVNSAKNQKDFIDAYKRRAEIMHESIPEFFDSREKESYLFVNFIKRAKYIARGEKDKFKREEGIRQLQKEIKALKKPGIKKLGFKKWFRGHCLGNYPLMFTKLMRMSGLLDLHSRYCAKNYYE